MKFSERRNNKVKWLYVAFIYQNEMKAERVITNIDYRGNDMK